MPLLAVQNKHEVCLDATQTAVSQDNGKSSSSKVRCQVAVLCCTKQCCTTGNLHLGVPIIHVLGALPDSQFSLHGFIKLVGFIWK